MAGRRIAVRNRLTLFVKEMRLLCKTTTYIYLFLFWRGTYLLVSLAVSRQVCREPKQRLRATLQGDRCWPRLLSRQREKRSLLSPAPLRRESSRTRNVNRTTARANRHGRADWTATTASWLHEEVASGYMHAWIHSFIHSFIMACIPTIILELPWPRVLYFAHSLSWIWMDIGRRQTRFWFVLSRGKTSW